MEANNMAAVHEAREPKPGQSWKDICAKCHDGYIEPRFCRYYGEPNGCNSPIYGEHPDPENPAALREALEKFLDLARRGLAFVTSYRYTEEDNDELEEAFANAKSALDKPARNCDRFNDELDAQLEFLNEVWLISVDRDTMLERDKIENWTRERCLEYAKWLMASAPTEGDKHGV